MIVESLPAIYVAKGVSNLSQISPGRALLLLLAL